MNDEYIKLTPFKMQVLQNFPFIDADFDALTNYELLCKVVEYLNLTIHDVEVLHDDVEEFSAKIDEFQHYFDNLDVQEEINNKLDQMAIDGTLTRLIGEYVDPVLNAYKQEVNSELNALSSSVDSRINALASGEPKGVYETTAALIAANPETGVYLVTDDGYVYSFVHNASSVTQLVEYQSSGIAAGSVGLYEISSGLKNELETKVKIQPTPTAGRHYRISDGVAVENTSSASYASYILDVSVGETYYLKYYEQSINTYGYIFVDDLTNMNVISYGMQGTGTLTKQSSYVKVPSGATKLLGSLYGTSPRFEDYEVYKVNEKSINDIEKALTKNFVYVIPEYTVTTDKHYRIVNGEPVANTDFAIYSTVDLDVTAGEAYYIKWVERSTLTQLYLVVDNNNKVIMSGGYGTGSDTEEEAHIIIPDGGVTLLISGYNSSATYPMTTPIIKKKASLESYLQGKKISILGDSVSTKQNRNAVEMTITASDVNVELSAYLTYYDVQNSLSLGGQTFTSDQVGSEVTFTPAAGDVNKVIGRPLNYNTTVNPYWTLLENNYGCTINPVAWSGASLSSHEKNTDIYKTSYGWHEAQIRKLGTRVAGSMTRNAPDLVIIYRGINDFSHTPYVSSDTSVFNNYNYSYPTDDYNESTSKYDFISAIGLTVKKIRAAYPKTKIAICTLETFKRVSYSKFPVNNGIYSLPQFNDTIRKAADFFGLDLIDLEKCGITFENVSTYTSDSVHPNDKGHILIYEQIAKDL